VQEKGATGRDEVGDTLPSLPVGTAMIWSPQWLEHFGKHRLLRKDTFDASATPKAGKARPAAALAPIDLDAVKVAMAATIEEAKANDPGALRAEVARLRRELEAAGRAAPAAKPVEVRVEVPVIPPALATALGRLRTVLSDAGVACEQMLEMGPASPPPRLPVTRTHLATLPKTAQASRRLVPAESLNGQWRPQGGALRMLQAIATSHADGLTWRQVAQLAGMKASGGSFGTYKSALRTHACVEERGGRVYLTEVGSAFAGDPGAPMSGPELVAYWQGKLPGKAKEMLATVVAMGPRGAITRTALAEAVEMEERGGSFGTYLSALRSNGLVTDGAEGLTAAEVFYR
jgi:hypothetical protein